MSSLKPTTTPQNNTNNKNNLKPLTIISHHHHHSTDHQECNCLFCNDQGISTPTPSSTLIVDDRRFFIPSEMWYEIFQYSDLFTLSILMQCQRKWKSLYKMRGFKSKIQFLRMMTVELVVAEGTTNQFNSSKMYSIPQYASSGKCKISLLVNPLSLSLPLNNKNRSGSVATAAPQYNDLTKVIKKLDTLKDYILKEIKLWEEVNGKGATATDQIFSVFKLMNDLFKPTGTTTTTANGNSSSISSTLSSQSSFYDGGKRKKFAKDAFARIALVGDNGMSKTTFFNTFRSQSENFETDTSNCLDDTVVMHHLNHHSNKMINSTQSSSSYQIWDNYQSIDVTMPPYFLRRINFLILMFDVSNLSSFTKLQTWVNQVVSGNVKIDTMPEFVLVGTKHDRLQSTLLDEYFENRETYYQPFADSLGIPYFEVDSTNISHVNSVIHYSLSWTYFVHLLQGLSSTLKQPDSMMMKNHYEKTAPTTSTSFHLPFHRSLEARQQLN